MELDWHFDRGAGEKVISNDSASSSTGRFMEPVKICGLFVVAAATARTHNDFEIVRFYMFSIGKKYITIFRVLFSKS